MLLGGRRILRTRYRPDRWGTAETVTALCGVGTGALLFATASLDPANLYPSLSPLAWPALAPLPAVAVTLAVLPGLVTPPPVLS
jgi:energy-coupling factor transport system permease protein